MVLDSKALSDTRKALKTEWLVTNGLGGYASSTVLGLNTRKYHGLLVAALNPPVDRCVLLSRLDEVINLGNQSFSLSLNEDARGVNLEGLHFLSGFSIDPFPSFTYRLTGSFTFKKTVFMPRERNASIVLYETRNSSKDKAKVTVTPMVNFRNFHWTTEKNQFRLNIKQRSSQTVLAQISTGQLALILSATDGRYVPSQGEWYEVRYRDEAERAESSVDHCYGPGCFEFEVEPNESKSIFLTAIAGKNENQARETFSIIGGDSTHLLRVRDEEVKRRIALLDGFCKNHADVEMEWFLKLLLLAADAFVVDRDSIRSKSVIAGYHWFNDWGRDSLVSLPGLTLVTGRFDDARQVLLTFQQYCKDGLVPNVFPDRAEDAPAYNVVDGTLWYFNAVLQCLKYTNDWQFVREKLWTTLKMIVDNHVHGTLFGIHMDRDGLLAHGPQLTWMDAAPDGKPVTPRQGKAVEIQALWFNALRIMQLLARRFGEKDKADEYDSLADNAKRSFLKAFWNSDKNCFFDVLNGSSKDGSLRPNQILTLSLDFTMPDKMMSEKVFETVRKEFLTPYGLRTLSVSDPRYAGKYRGNRWERDQTYHNGTVWPWPLGSFVTAFLKLRNHDASSRSYAFENFLKPLLTEGLSRSCLGSISEIFDGDPPHEPNGCIAQAWSVAEPLRAYVEDVLLERPPYEKQVLATRN